MTVVQTCALPIYRPSIDTQLAKLFERSIPDKKETPAATIVDWDFLDTDDGQPGEPADWVKKQMQSLERYKDEADTKEMLAEIQRIHKWTRNIPPPTAPKMYDPNEPPFNSTEMDDELDDEFDDL